jgi:methionine-rich copper-binding protein CopC
MRVMMKALAPALLVVALGAAPAFAHAHLVSEVPPENTAGSAPTQISLKFSEGVVLNFTGVTLSGPSGAVTLGTAGFDPKDSTQLVVPLPVALPAGTYTVAWHALSTDGHQSTGSYSFTVN